MTLIVKETPAMVCDNCGEQYFDSDVTDRLLCMANQASRDGVELIVRSYVPAQPGLR